jgi:hypothetical protein
MAYNGSGTFNRVHNFATDKTNLVPVTASRMDAEMDGIATGLSTAIAKDGQTPTTARIPFAAGASAFVGATSGTSYSFTNDPNTGLYSPAADQFGLAAGGVATVTSTATAVTVPVNLAVTGDLAVTGAVTGVFASGTVMLFMQQSAPTGWTKATTHGDKALRLVAGLTGGTAGGSTGFSTIFAARTITQGNLPNVTLTTTITDPGHDHAYFQFQDGGTLVGVLSPGGTGHQAAGDNAAATAGASLTGITASTALGGSGTAMDFAVQYVDIIAATKN